MWLVYALATVALTSILATLMRVLALKIVHERAFAFTYNFMGLVVLLALLVFTGIGSTHLNGYLVALLIASGVGYGLFQRFQFTVRKHIEVSALQTIITPTVIAGYILAVVWLHEPVTAVRLLGFALVMASAFLVIARHKKLRLSGYTLMTLAIGVSLAFTTPLDRRVSPHFGHILTYVAIIWFAQTLVTFVPYVSPSAMDQELKQHSWKLPTLVAINLVATYTLIAAIRLAPATRVQPILASNAVLIALFGVVFLKEYDRKWLKLVAAVVSAVGLILISR